MEEEKWREGMWSGRGKEEREMRGRRGERSKRGKEDERKKRREE